MPKLLMSAVLGWKIREMVDDLMGWLSYIIPETRKRKGESQLPLNYILQDHPPSRVIRTELEQGVDRMHDSFYG